MTETSWRCEACGAYNIISYEPDASVYEVVELLRASHRADSPGCPGDLNRIRMEATND